MRTYVTVRALRCPLAVRVTDRVTRKGPHSTPSTMAATIWIIDGGVAIGVYVLDVHDVVIANSDHTTSSMSLGEAEVSSGAEVLALGLAPEFHRNPTTAEGDARAASRVGEKFS